MTDIDLLKSSLYENLPYRYKLEVKKYFGLEIEMNLLKKEDEKYIFSKELEEKRYYKSIDTSMGELPLEIASPKLKGNEDTWKTLEDLSNRMKECELDFSMSSFQVNLDSDLTTKELYSMILFFRTFEHIIYKFSKGFDESLRNIKNARSLSDFLLYNYFNEKCNYSLEEIMWNKKYGISLKNDKPYFRCLPITIVEFRTPNGCNDCWLWQNYVNIFYHFFKSIHSLDLDYINYEFCNSDTIRNSEKLYLKDAIKFANIIFEEDIDKIYFLKHYIGNDEEKVKNSKILRL